MPYSTVACRGVAALAGVLGLIVLIVSAVLLSEAIEDRTELGYIFGSPIPKVGAQSISVEVNKNHHYEPYNTKKSYSFDFMGYDVDAIVGISAGGVVIGLLQIISCVLLCLARRGLAIGWIVVQVILLLGVLVCFAMGIYWQVYYYRDLFPGTPLGVGAHSQSGRYGYGGHRGLENYQNSLYHHRGGGIGNYRGGHYGGGGSGGNLGGNQRYYEDDDCNPTGVAYCTILGLDLVLLLVGMLIVGGAGLNKKDYRDNRMRDSDMHINSHKDTVKGP